MKSEICSGSELKLWLEGGREFTDTVLVNLDMREYDLELASKNWRGSVLMGCQLGPASLARAVSDGALVFPDFEDKDYDPYRTTLYRVQDLYAGFDPLNPDASYLQTPDFKIFSSCKDVEKNVRRSVSIDEKMARHIHDNSIDAALQVLLKNFWGEGVVAVMGGHDRLRTDPVYEQVARLSRELTRLGYMLVSGGGPGLMEATNLGAYFAPHSEDQFREALALLAVEPCWKRLPQWIASAWGVLHRFPSPDLEKSLNLGVPTWFYGHEPPNVFPTHVAKFFDNSVREESLLGIATHGVIYAEGNAGTIQEIFQDGCQNYYRTYGFSSPMIFLGKAYWNPAPGNQVARSKPVFPLVQILAAEQRFGHLVHCTDDPEEVALIIQNYRPIRTASGRIS